MPRTYHKKGIHTSPEKAGVKNMPDPDTLPKDEESFGKKTLPIMLKKDGYTSQWSDEQLADSIADFFKYCAENEIKPTQPLLRLWLKVSRDTLWDWRTKPERYGVKCDIIRTAMDYLESYLQSDLNRYPTGNIFLLKSSHGHKDSVDVTINGSATTEDVAGRLAQLGLDKDE